MMAKVLKSNRDGEVAYSTMEGARYTFPTGGEHPNCDGSELIKNDDHAKQLLKLYPANLTEIPFDKWSPKQKAAAQEYDAAILKEAALKYPGMIKDKIAGLVGTPEPKKEEEKKNSKK